MTGYPRRRPGRDDRGQVTFWMLGFTFVILVLGLGVSVEGARIWSAWRSVAGIADAAAAAGASGIDETAFRTSNGQTIQLDATTAEELAYANVDTQPDNDDITSVQVTATTDHVTVVVHAEVDLFILGARGPFEHRYRHRRPSTIPIARHHQGARNDATPPPPPGDLDPHQRVRPPAPCRLRIRRR
jgi:Flp pilus assembly protein TadG